MLEHKTNFPNKFLKVWFSFLDWVIVLYSIWSFLWVTEVDSLEIVTRESDTFRSSFFKFLSALGHVLLFLLTQSSVFYLFFLSVPGHSFSFVLSEVIKMRSLVRSRALRLRSYVYPRASIGIFLRKTTPSTRRGRQFFQLVSVPRWQAYQLKGMTTTSCWRRRLA